MFFHVRDLEIRPQPFEETVQPGQIDYHDPKLRQVGPLVASGKAELVLGSSGEIRVRGHLSVTMEADCDRCLERAEFPLDSDFELYYRPVEEGYGEEKAIDSGESEMGFYEGEGIELNEVLREQILLSMPMQQICSEACKGICPVCGQNRNQIECGCQVVGPDDRWAALRQFEIAGRTHAKS